MNDVPTPATNHQYDEPMRKGAGWQRSKSMTEKALPVGKIETGTATGSTKQPIYDGTRRKMHDKEGVPNIKQGQARPV
jgi:hypothetical protein